MDASPNSGQPGQPALPARGARILIPYGMDVANIEIKPGEKVILGEGYVVEPTATPVPLSVDPIDYLPPAPDPAIYARDTPFPDDDFELVGRQSFRGYQILVLKLQPVHVIPAMGELWYYPSMRVIVNLTESGRDASPMLRGVARDAQEVSAMVDNPGEAATYPTAIRDGNQNFDLMILTLPVWVDAFQPLKDYHDSTGLATEIFTIADVGGWTPEDIRDFIREKYVNDGISYVLIGEDDNLIPAKDLYAEVLIYVDGTSVIDFAMPTDLYYGCLDGTYNYDGDDRWGEPTDGDDGGDVDLIAEVYVGRASVENASDVQRFVNKTIEFLEADDGYIDNVLVCSEHLGGEELKMYGYAMMDDVIDGAVSHSYTTVGIPSDLYAVDKLYDIDWAPSWDGWPVEEVCSRINSGVQIVNHLGHNHYWWALKIHVDNLFLLTNDDPCFIYSQGCYAGGYDSLYFPCWAERVTVKTEAGAFAAIMNSRYGWAEFSVHPITSDGASQRYNREFWDAVFNPAENKPEIGRANQDSKEDNLYRINEGAMRWVYYELNLFGDPTVPIKRPHGLQFTFPDGVPQLMTPGEPATFAINVSGLYGGTAQPGSGQLHYRLNDGELQTAAMTEVMSGQYEAALPAIACGDELAFYASAEVTGGGRFYEPPADSPFAALAPVRIQSTFEDDFETDKGWSVSGGLWARGIPTGGGGENGWPDPTAGCNGPSVFGYNLDGDYENNLAEKHLTSPSIDCSALGEVLVSFQRWLGVEQPPWDRAYFRVSTNGIDWFTIWENSGQVFDSSWMEMNFDISTLAAYQSEVYLRWTMGSTNFDYRFCGWNIDDVRVFGYDCRDYICGDANGDESINVGDAVYLINYVFKGGDPPDPPGAGEVNCDGAINVGDAVYLINHIFKGGDHACAACP